MFKPSVLALLLALSAPAFADPLYTCSTQSNGYPFQDSEYDLGTAQQGALNACRSAYGTDYYQCGQNLRCVQQANNPNPGNGGYFGTWGCRDFSQGRSFTVSGQGEYYDMLQRVINACNLAAPYTNPYECQQNAYCQQ